MKASIILLSLLSMSLLSGCQTISRHPDYVGADSATLCGRTDPNPFNKNPNVAIMAVDGVRTPGAKCKTPLILKPGKHEVRVFVNILSNATFTVETDLEPNQKYQIRGRYGSTWVGQETYSDEGDKYTVYLLNLDSEEKTPLNKIVPTK